MIMHTFRIMPWSHLCVKPPRMSHVYSHFRDLGDTWLTRGKYGIYVAVRGSYGVCVTPSLSTAVSPTWR